MKRKGRYRFYILVLLFISCQNDGAIAPEQITELSGGKNFTIFDTGENAFGQSGDAITNEELREFVFGNTLFRNNWVQAPASVTSLDGLGEVFNARSCGGCHFKDGRGAPFDAFAVKRPGILWRISTTGNSPHRMYGAQIQDLALPNIPIEGNVETTYEIIQGTYEDGTTYQLRKPIIELVNFGYGAITEEYALSTRVAPHLAGLGLLEAINPMDILANEDEHDSNKDGISGRAIYVTNLLTGMLEIGRFGWKSEQPTIAQQNASAFAGDMGLTSALFPTTDFTMAQQQLYPNIANGGTPEVTDTQIKAITTYIQTLAVPARRNIDAPAFTKGMQLFRALNCNACHVESYTTKLGNNIQSLDAQTIFPYTDLLLHDMGEGLADESTAFNQTIRKEWRTPPLWGIGLFQNVNKHTRYLHDGRARNIEEAILWHGGEAEYTKQKFKQLTKEERDNLIFFLKNI